ncbi:hypothetical protein Droror1_Dr00001325 [Drosera rotundifolia]
MWKNASSNYLVEELMDFNMVDRQDQMCGCRILQGGWIFGMHLCRYKSTENLKFMLTNALMLRKLLQQKRLIIGCSSPNQVTIKT